MGRSMRGKVIAIIVGTFVGGGVGFYVREVYQAQQREEYRNKLSAELQEISERRKSKERLLNSLAKQD